MTVLLRRFGDVRLLRYLLASVGALALDMGGFLALLALGVSPAAASALSYGLGILAHWLLSSRSVFADGLAPSGIERTQQKALFVGSALVGLTLTTAIVGAGHMEGMDPRAAKLLAVAVSFTATWLLRSRIVFRVAR